MRSKDKWFLLPPSLSVHQKKQTSMFIVTIDVHSLNCKLVSSVLFEKEYPTTVYLLGSSLGHLEPVPPLLTNVASLTRDL